MKKTFNNIKKHRVILSACVGVFIIMSVFVGMNRDRLSANVSKSELAYTDTSPLGTSGGSVMPASCDSYPAHSTCACTLGQTQSTVCVVYGGVGSNVSTCINSAGSNVWSPGTCGMPITCNPGYDLAFDYYGHHCMTSCTGNNYRTYTTTYKEVCVQWSVAGRCSIVAKEDPKSFASLLAPEKANALICCFYDTETITVGNCSACPAGQIPNPDHTSCVTPAVPAVNVHF